MPEPAPVHTWLTAPMPAGVREAVERVANGEDVRHVAVMPDVHLANDVCNGLVVGTAETVYPQAVGGDIGCGMAAILLGGDAALLRSEQNAARVLHAFQDLVPVMRQSGPRLLESEATVPQGIALSDSRLQKAAERDGRVQLGSLGRGNHFVEIQADEDDRLWLMVHSGSRSMGQVITAHHLERATKARNGLLALDGGEAVGRAYLHDMHWAVDYAARSRRVMIDRIGAFFTRAFELTPDVATLVDRPHNFVDREVHAGRELWVHRKGAMRAGRDEPGIIPGSMGTVSFHVAGRGHAEALLSCSHGAGRELSRTDARRRISVKEFRREVGALWYDQRIERALLEEAPGAYKDVRKVMRAQKDLVRIVRTLRPLLVHKGA